MDDNTHNSWAFGKNMFHADPMAMEPEMQGVQVHPLHAIFAGIIAIASTEESQKNWGAKTSFHSTGSKNWPCTPISVGPEEIHKKMSVRRVFV